MQLHDFIIEHAEQWTSYERPTIDWYSNEKGKPSRKIQNILKECPAFEKVMEGIPHQLTRQKVWDCYHEDLYKGFIATILWDILYRDHVPISRILPIIKEPANAVRTKMDMMCKHLRRGESLSFIFDAANSPTKLQLAQGVGRSFFTLVFYFLAADIEGILHPLMFNNFMQRIHCALMMEESGNATPYYRVDNGKVLLAEGGSEAECYEAYCIKLGDLSLEAGCGNPERLVDWLIYSDHALEAKPIAREVLNGTKPILQSSRELMLGIEMPPIGSVDMLGNCPMQELAGKDDQIAEYAANLYTIDDDGCELMYNTMAANGLIKNRTNYAHYDERNKGCNIDNPFIIDKTEVDLNLATTICEYIHHWTSRKDKRTELTNQILRSHNGRRIFNLVYWVFVDGNISKEQYFFDVTKAFIN